MKELLRECHNVVGEVSRRLGELLDGWYGEYLGMDEADTVAEHIAGGGTVKIRDTGEPHDVCLFRRMRFLLGRLDCALHRRADAGDICPSCALMNLPGALCPNHAECGIYPTAEHDPLDDEDEASLPGPGSSLGRPR